MAELIQTVTKFLNALIRQLHFFRHNGI